MNLLRKDILLYVIHAITGLVFIFSAILKLISLDSFELYIYSFGFFNLSLSSLAAKSFIGIEFFLGTGLLLNFYPKFFRVCTLLLLCCFSVFLVYVYFTLGNEDNCHCFGDLIELNPLPSFIKNIILILLLIPTYQLKPFQCRYKKLITIILASILIIVIIVSLLSNIYYNLKKDSDTYYNQSAAIEFINNHPEIKEISKTEPVIACFFGIGCKYCELTAKKLHLIEKNNPEVKTNFIGVFWGKEDKYEHFVETTGLEYQKTLFIDPITFLTITKESMPLIFIIENEEITQCYMYNDLQERTLLKAIQ